MTPPIGETMSIATPEPACAIPAAALLPEISNATLGTSMNDIMNAVVASIDPDQRKRYSRYSSAAKVRFNQDIGATVRRLRCRPPSTGFGGIGRASLRPCEQSVSTSTAVQKRWRSSTCQNNTQDLARYGCGYTPPRSTRPTPTYAMVAVEALRPSSNRRTSPGWTRRASSRKWATASTPASPSAIGPWPSWFRRAATVRTGRTSSSLPGRSPWHRKARATPRRRPCR